MIRYWWYILYSLNVSCCVMTSLNKIYIKLTTFAQRHCLDDDAADGYEPPVYNESQIFKQNYLLIRHTTNRQYSVMYCFRLHIKRFIDINRSHKIFGEFSIAAHIFHAKQHRANMNVVYEENKHAWIEKERARERLEWKNKCEKNEQKWHLLLVVSFFILHFDPLQHDSFVYT